MFAPVLHSCLLCDCLKRSRQLGQSYTSRSFCTIHTFCKIIIYDTSTNLKSIKYASFQLFRDDAQMYLKQQPFLSRSLTNCFISPSLIWYGGRMIFSLLTNGSLTMFAEPRILLRARLLFPNDLALPYYPTIRRRKVLRISTLLPK